MGLYLKKIIDNNSILGLWEMEEEVKALLQRIKLSARDTITFNAFRNDKRRREWLSTRILLNELLKSNIYISYDEYGKPWLENSPYNISISHTNGIVGVMLTTKKQLGLDIERMSSKIGKIALKFLNSREFQMLSVENRIFHLYIHWCAKEALFKIYGKNSLSFTKNLTINPFDIQKNGQITGNIITNFTHEEYKLNYFTLDDYIIVWGFK
jgi:phosphopantetheinyl transferase